VDSNRVHILFALWGTLWFLWQSPLGNPPSHQHRGAKHFEKMHWRTRGEQSLPVPVLVRNAGEALSSIHGLRDQRDEDKSSRKVLSLVECC
jgi:hypothetical protein